MFHVTNGEMRYLWYNGMLSFCVGTPNNNMYNLGDKGEN